MSNVEGRNSIDFIKRQGGAIPPFDIPLGQSPSAESSESNDSSQAAVHYSSVLRFAFHALASGDKPPSLQTNRYLKK